VLTPAEKGTLSVPENPLFLSSNHNVRGQRDFTLPPGHDTFVYHVAGQFTLAGHHQVSKTRKLPARVESGRVVMVIQIERPLTDVDFMRLEIPGMFFHCSSLFWPASTSPIYARSTRVSETYLQA
jgi:hypothetical protein